MKARQFDDYSSFPSFRDQLIRPLYLSDALSTSNEVILKDSLYPKQPPVAAVAKEPKIVAVEGDSETEYCSDSSVETISKKVVFALDVEGNVLETCCYPRVTELTPEDRQILWYRGSEFKYFRKYCKKLATIAAASKYGKDFHKTYRACTRTDVKDLDKYSKIANSAARGLEVLVAPVLMKDRKTAVRTILNAQAKFPEDMPMADQQTILCATSRVLSRHSRLLAKLLATGDANVAMAIHESKSEEEESEEKEAEVEDAEVEDAEVRDTELRDTEEQNDEVRDVEDRDTEEEKAEAREAEEHV
jgi:hypothetical protein